MKEVEFKIIVEMVNYATNSVETMVSQLENTHRKREEKDGRGEGEKEGRGGRKKIDSYLLSNKKINELKDLNIKIKSHKYLNYMGSNFLNVDAQRTHGRTKY